tara:strand:- start:36 stop:299 length:264 start_codon:yes stop_codon:yes gene_type:complete
MTKSMSVISCVAYYAPTSGCRYFTKKSAIKAEANAIIAAKYPTVQTCQETGESFYYKEDLKGYEKILRRLSRLIEKSIKLNQQHNRG